MKNRRRLVMLPLLILLAAVLLVPVSADNEVVASGDWGGGNVLWTITADGTLTLNGPRYMEGATNGNFPWKDHADKVTRIVVEDGLTSIADQAFSQMVNVRTVELGQTIQSIGEFAFSGCTALESVNIPLNVKELGHGAFFLCQDLTTVDFDEHCALTEIGDSAFQHAGLTTLTLPSRIISIGQRAFYECRSLAEVNLNEGLEEVGEEAFYGCKSITSLTIPSTLHTIRWDAFRGLEKLTRLELYTNIDYAQNFPYCGGVTSVVFHDNMTTIGGFQNCTTLEEVILPDSVTTISGDTFRGCTSLTEIDWPANLTTIEDFAFAQSGIVRVVLPDTVTVLEGSAFRGCKSLTEFKAGSGLEAISACTFFECTALTSVDMGNVRSIGFEAFNGCTALTDLVWSENVETMGYLAFTNCDALTEITIPASVQQIDHSAFTNCENLTEVTFLGDVPSIGSYTFSNVTATVYYPAGNATWSEDVMQDYGGTLTWTAASGERSPGDVNGDDTVNADDAIHLLYHTLFGDLYPVYGDGDVNSDGAVDSDDAFYLLYHTLFGEEQYPLYPDVSYPLFEGPVDASTAENVEHKNMFDESAYAAYIELNVCGQSAGAEERIKTEFENAFGFAPTAEIAVEHLGTYQVQGYTGPQEVYRYSIWDTTYPLMDNPMYEVYTQTCTDGSPWAGFCVDRSEWNTMGSQDWYGTLCDEMYRQLEEVTGMTIDELRATGKYDFNMISDAGTIRTSIGTTRDVIYVYSRGYADR